MTDAGLRDSPRIFISYRRDETAYPAGWLYDRLTEHFGKGSVFKDLDSIDLGDDFAAAIATAVAACDVLLALIGDRWTTMTDEYGHRRLDQPDDFVRREIEAALTRDVRLIPILVDRARMPGVDELPPSLAPIVRRQALDISPGRFEFDTARLIAVLNRILNDKQVSPGVASPAIPPSGRRTKVALAIVAAVVLLTAVLIISTFKSGDLRTGTSSPPTTAQMTAPATPRSASPGTIIAADDFSSTANGWAVSALSPHGESLVNGKYRLSLDPAPGGTGAGAFPGTLPVYTPLPLLVSWSRLREAG